MTVHQRIPTPDDQVAFDRVFYEAVPIVRTLATERSKRWPRKLVDQQRHQGRISDLESELTRVASRIDWTPTELEKTVRTELERRGRRVPVARAAPVIDTPEQRKADFDVSVARDAVAESERLIRFHQANLVKRQIDLSRKRETARLIREGSAKA